jgi:hypothetical protein
MRLHAIAALVAASTLFASPAAAQASRVVVRVVAEGSGAALPGIGVVLRGTQLQGVTGPDGTFTFAAVPRGTYALELRDGSGQAQERRLTVRRPEVVVTLRVRPGATELEPLVVTAMTDERRTARAMGTRRDFFDREYIEQNRAGKRHVGNLLQGQVPGLKVFEGTLPGETGEAPAQRVCIESSRRHMNFGRRPCWMVAVYVDGIRISDPGAFLLTYPIEQFESVEMLGPIQATTRYGTNAALGVLEIYTRGNGPHARRPSQEPANN